MKTKNKKDTSESNSRNKPLSLVIVSVAIAVAIFSSLYFLLQPNPPIQPRAAIIDQLSSSQLAINSRHPNQTFIEMAKTLLYERFPEIDYYLDNATVDQYKRLSTHGYKFILWRAHSALDLTSSYIAISTSEKYVSNNYERYLEDGQLTLCNITGDQNLYFGITPKFIRESMSGKFQDTIIVLMSCNGLKEGYYSTAEAFREKGAKVFVSWDGWIESPDNDNRISTMLDYLIDQNNTISEAVGKTPPCSSTLFGSASLDFYPRETETANYRIPDYRQTNSIATSTPMTMIASKNTNERLKTKQNRVGLSNA